MAKISWDEKAELVLDIYVENAYHEFGASTAKKWLLEKETIEWRLERYPTSYPFEELLLGRKIQYRRCSMMNRRFRLIYYFDETDDVIHIVDIWDSKRNPKALIKRIK